jgi:hypothetical protein
VARERYAIQLGSVSLLLLTVDSCLCSVTTTLP